MRDETLDACARLIRVEHILRELPHLGFTPNKDMTSRQLKRFEEYIGVSDKAHALFREIYSCPWEDIYECVCHDVQMVRTYLSGD